jgi:serine/threonine-protein kinase
MGIVRRARDRILRRDVAIKMMKDQLAGSPESEAVRGQFLKEARVGGRLLHPNILSVFDLGVNREEKIYYTMRLVNGDSLQANLNALEMATASKLVPFPLRMIVQKLLVGICNGVDFAHQSGVLHLDLKPANILVSGFEEVFVIDWGLARVDDLDDSERLADLYRDSAPPDTASATSLIGGRVLGTPGYMAPEQSIGDMLKLNEGTDVYGIGGILHFILYGAPPNWYGRPPATAAQAGLRPEQKLRPAILPRGHRILPQVQASLTHLRAICQQALEVDPTRRFRTVEALLVDLNEWLASPLPEQA